jgi:hypothetical protein
MGLIIQQRALQAASGLWQVLPVVRKRDRSLFDQIHRAMHRRVARPKRCEQGFSLQWPTDTSRTPGSKRWTSRSMKLVRCAGGCRAVNTGAPPEDNS